MAPSTSFSICSNSRFSCYAFATQYSPFPLRAPSPSSLQVGRDLNRLRGCKGRALLHQSKPAELPSLSRRSPLCYSESDEIDSASSSSSTSSAPPSTPLESSSSSEGSGELPRGQQRRRPQGAPRKADSTDWISSTLTRRFGLAGGLAWVGFLAFGVISEQIKTRTEVFLESEGTQDVEGRAKEVVLDNNVKYVDVRTGGGSAPLKGDLVVLDLTGKVASTGEVFVDTTAARRPLAFVYGLKPYSKGVCYGLEYALQSMKAGGKRRVTVPADQCFGDVGEDLGNGVIVPGGADIEYEVQLQRVSIAPS